MKSVDVLKLGDFCTYSEIFYKSAIAQSFNLLNTMNSLHRNEPTHIMLSIHFTAKNAIIVVTGKN